MSLADNLPEGHQFAVAKELILVQQEVEKREEILANLSDLLYEQGYVKASFKNALLSREKEFPTGLLTKVTGVAIPHTGSNHVIKPAIAIGTLKKPIHFFAMDNPSKTVLVDIVLLLAIRESDSHLAMLQRIMKILHQEDVLIGIQEAKTDTEVMGLIMKHLSTR